jgi:hypothetical protein
VLDQAQKPPNVNPIEPVQYIATKISIVQNDKGSRVDKAGLKRRIVDEVSDKQLTQDPTGLFVEPALVHLNPSSSLA